jgi:DNA-binding cell septation regulator SpoVG
MQIKILNFSHSSKAQVLASVRIELSVEGTSDSVIIDDTRVLRNRHGQLWLAMPSYSIPTDGKGYDYLPAIVLSTKLKREIEDVVLPAYEDWERQQHAVSANGGVR